MDAHERQHRSVRSMLVRLDFLTQIPVDRFVSTAITKSTEARVITYTRIKSIASSSALHVGKVLYVPSTSSPSSCLISCSGNNVDLGESSPRPSPQGLFLTTKTIRPVVFNFGFCSLVRLSSLFLAHLQERKYRTSQDTKGAKCERCLDIECVVGRAGAVEAAEKDSNSGRGQASSSS